MIQSPKKPKMNPLLLKVIVISVGIHVIAGFIAGIITVANIVIQEDVQFEEPPAVVEEEPPPEVKVRIQPPQPKLQPPSRLSIRPVANIVVSDVSVDLPSMGDNFTVSAGLGGLGGGSLLGGAGRGRVGIGMSDVSVFGLKARAERILIVVDASKRMMVDEKGGLHSYRVIKDEVTDLIGGLSAGTLFNVVLYDHGRVAFFKPQLVSAGAGVHQELVQWLAPINSNVNRLGISSVGAKLMPLSATVDPEMLEQFKATRSSVSALTHLVLEQNVDAIFMITGYHAGFERIRGVWTARDDEEWARIINAPKYQEQLAAHKAGMPEMKRRVTAALEAENQKRAKRGLPPKVFSNGGVYQLARELNVSWKAPHPQPQHRPANWIEASTVRSYFKKLVRQLYEDRNRQAPSINVVLFLAGDEKLSKEKQDNLKSYVNFFRGKHRTIRGLDEIKSASSNSSAQ